DERSLGFFGRRQEVVLPAARDSAFRRFGRALAGGAGLGAEDAIGAGVSGQRLRRLARRAAHGLRSARRVAPVARLDGLPRRSRGVAAYPTAGGAPTRICFGWCAVKWTLDGAHLFLTLAGTTEKTRTLIVPLPRGRSIPVLPPDGIRSDAEIVRLPGATQVVG